MPVTLVKYFDLENRIAHITGNGNRIELNIYGVGLHNLLSPSGPELCSRRDSQQPDERFSPRLIMLLYPSPAHEHYVWFFVLLSTYTFYLILSLSCPNKSMTQLYS